MPTVTQAMLQDILLYIELYKEKQRKLLIDQLQISKKKIHWGIFPGAIFLN